MNENCRSRKTVSDKTIEQKRWEGEFFTPLPFAAKALEYLDAALGKSVLSTGKYRLWDMAAGTGHLEYHLPKEVLPYCYLSTLYQEDVEKLEKHFPRANVFQYNYLEDDADCCTSPVLWRSMPKALQDDLANPAVLWIILVNPPYATAQEAAMSGTSKSGVAETKIRQRMHGDGLGEVSRELYTQFLYRIHDEFKNRDAVLGLFAPVKYLVSTNYHKFRENIFRYTFQSGFVFSSGNFPGTSRSNLFPVSFIVWNLSRKQSIDKQNIVLDVLDENAEKTGTKRIRCADRQCFLNRWIKRPAPVSIFPSFSSAITIKDGNTDVRNRVADNFLASLMCPGNELQNQQKTALLSGPQVSAGALSVTAENFEQAVVVFASRRIPQNTWLTHVDQFMQPHRKLCRQFIQNCAIWSIFDVKNQTVALRNIVYRGQIYQIVNHFFPFLFAGLRNWIISDENIRATADNVVQDSFVANWLSCQNLPVMARDVLERGREVYRFYFANLHRLALSKFKIETYDAGFWQIRRGLQYAEIGSEVLAALKSAHEELRSAILPQLSDYGIIE